jgi:hypothetical protein
MYCNIHILVFNKFNLNNKEKNREKEGNPRTHTEKLITKYLAPKVQERDAIKRNILEVAGNSSRKK